MAGRPQDGLSSILIGMAHRGRLNVLAHILNKPYAQILAEFKDPVKGARQARGLSSARGGSVVNRPEFVPRLSRRPTGAILKL